MVMRDFMCEAEPSGELQDMADLWLWHSDRMGDVAHARRAETLGPTEERRDHRP